MRPPGNLALFLLIAGLVAAVVAWFPGSSQFAQQAGESPEWEDWRRLPKTEQRTLIERYQELARNPATAAALTAAASFAGMSDRAQQRLRGAADLLQSALDRQSPVQRRDLSRLDPAARARRLYDLMTGDERAALHRLAIQQ